MTSKPGNGAPGEVTATPRRPAGQGRLPGARLFSNGIPQVFLLGWTLIVSLPLLWIIIASVKDNREIYTSPFGLPSQFHFGTFVDAWNKANIGQFFINSLIVVSCGVVLTLALSSMVACVISRYRFPGSRLIYYLFIIGMTIPLFLAIVPLVNIAQSLGLYQNKPGLILIYVAFSLPFSVFFLTAFFQSLPSELAEAAYIDGAGHFGVFFRVMLPLARPGIISIGSSTSSGSGTSTCCPLYSTHGLTNNAATSSSPRVLLTWRNARTMRPARPSVAELFAGLLIAMVPVVVVYVVFQRKVEEGLTAGALK